MHGSRGMLADCLVSHEGGCLVGDTGMLPLVGSTGGGSSSSSSNGSSSSGESGSSGQSVVLLDDPSTSSAFSGESVEWVNMCWRKVWAHTHS